MINMLHDKESANVQWADKEKKKVTSIACLFCSTTIKGVSFHSSMPIYKAHT